MALDGAKKQRIRQMAVAAFVLGFLLLVLHFVSPLGKWIEAAALVFMLLAVGLQLIWFGTTHEKSGPPDQS